MSGKKGTENRDLVICNNCLWAVPVCNGKDLEVIPVEDYEDYKLEITLKRGLSIEFTGEG